MRTKSIRAGLITIAIVLSSPRAFATNWAGDGTSCRWATFADAIANSGGAPIYLVAGHIFEEGGVTIAVNQEIHVGDASCTPFPGSGVKHAVISGVGQTLDHIVITAGDVLFDRVDVVDHVSANYGGNIDVRGGTLTLRNSVVSGGLALVGGGIHSSGATLRIHGDDTRITRNTAGEGGGIKAFGAEVHVTDGATISYNTAGDSGGLWLDAGGTLYLADRATITRNTATSLGGFAGGGWLAGSSLDTSACTACEISHNTAAGYGGGLVVSGGAAFVHLYNIAVTKNSASGLGGGAAIFGVSGSSSEILVSGATFDGNTAGGGNGGGLLVQGPGIATSSSINPATFTNNHASMDGGGLYLEGATVGLTSCELAKNTADGSGGGIAVERGGSANLLSVWDHDNLASDSGGGIFVAGSSNVRCDESWIHTNTATQSGGGIALHGSGLARPTLTMTGECDSAPDGGPLLADQYCSELRDNVAGSKGGGLFMDGGDGTIDRTAFLHNSATVAGQAIDLVSDKSPVLTLTNSLVAEHTATSNVVVAIGNGSTFGAEHVTVTANSGVPVRYDGSAMGHFRRSIVWNADAFTIQGSLALDATCTSFGQTGGGSGVAGSGTISGINVVYSTDPSFDVSPRGNYRLRWVSQLVHSPEIDACLTGLATDLDGHTRPVMLVMGKFVPRYDRGAFERQ